MTNDGDNARLPDLDYALLAEFAKVEDHGAVTVVGGSFLRVTVPALPALVPFAVAGRVRVAEGTTETLEVECEGPGENAPSVSFSIPMQSTEQSTYEGRCGVLFAVNMSMPIIEAGAVSVTLRINEQPVRCLKFQVGVPKA